MGGDTGTWDCCPLPVPVGCGTEGDLDTPPSGARAWQSFCFPPSVKGEPGNPLGFPGSRPQSQFLHIALGQPCVLHHSSARLGWGTPSSSTEHGTPSPCRAAERGWQVLARVLLAQRLWSLWGSSATQSWWEHVPSWALCVSGEEYPALDAGAGSPQAGRGGPGEGLPPPAVFGGPGTIVLSPWSWCSGGHVRAQPGRAALGGRWEPCPPWHMLIACNGESSISSNP